uniref:Cytochrome P450 n=1 Tax=Manihot esculenta TaxID=3983 RepID=A0A2C9UI96_MANES
MEGIMNFLGMVSCWIYPKKGRPPPYWAWACGRPDLLFTLNPESKLLGRNPPLPPGPFAWPIIGNLLQMGKDVHVSLANLAKVHGPLMSLRLGTQLLVVGSNAAAAREILKTHDRKLSGRFVSHSFAIGSPERNHLSLGFAKECTDQWRLLKTFSGSHLFSTKAIEAHKNVRETKVLELVSFLTVKAGENKMVDIGRAAYTTFINIMSNAIFSVDILDYEGKGSGKEIKKLFMEIIEMGGIPNLSDFYPILGGFDFQAFSYWFFTFKCVQELLTAASDTSSSTIEWAMAELIRNADTMNRLRAELALVIGEDTIKDSHLHHLPYLQACVKEILRLHPPGPLLLPHRAVESCEVMGYNIPKDTQVLVNMWAVGRDPTAWDDPLSFKPERFVGSRLDFKGNDFQYVPFGGGRRICGGLILAARQIPLVLGSLVHSFDWVVPGDVDLLRMDMREKLNLTMRKKHSLYLIPKVRK